MQSERERVVDEPDATDVEDATDAENADDEENPWGPLQTFLPTEQCADPETTLELATSEYARHCGRVRECASKTERQNRLGEIRLGALKRLYTDTVENGELATERTRKSARMVVESMEKVVNLATKLGLALGEAAATANVYWGEVREEATGAEITLPDPPKESDEELADD